MGCTNTKSTEINELKGEVKALTDLVKSMQQPQPDEPTTEEPHKPSIVEPIEAPLEEPQKLSTVKPTERNIKTVTLNLNQSHSDDKELQNLAETITKKAKQIQSMLDDSGFATLLDWEHHLDDEKNHVDSIKSDVKKPKRMADHVNERDAYNACKQLATELQQLQTKFQEDSSRKVRSVPALGSGPGALLNPLSPRKPQEPHEEPELAREGEWEGGGDADCERKGQAQIWTDGVLLNCRDRHGVNIFDLLENVKVGGRLVLRINDKEHAGEITIFESKNSHVHIQTEPPIPRDQRGHFSLRILHAEVSSVAVTYTSPDELFRKPLFAKLMSAVEANGGKWDQCAQPKAAHDGRSVDVLQAIALNDISVNVFPLEVSTSWHTGDYPLVRSSLEERPPTPQKPKPPQSLQDTFGESESFGEFSPHPKMPADVLGAARHVHEWRKKPGTLLAISMAKGEGPLNDLDDVVSRGVWHRSEPEHVSHKAKALSFCP